MLDEAWHYCRCGRWGAYGFGVRFMAERHGAWFCAAHRDEGKDIVLEENLGMAHVPTIHRAKCYFCGHELDTREGGVHQHVSGWVMNREGGGGHGVSLPRRENMWAHHDCVRKKTKDLFK